MLNLDELLKRELPRTISDADPDEVLRRLSSRKGRRAVVRRIQRFGLVVVVVAGTIAGVLGLEHVFRTGASVPGTSETPVVPPPTNGLIVMSVADDGGSHLYVWDPSHPEIDPREHILTPSEGVAVHDTDPAVSPDGTTVVFAREELPEGPNAPIIYSVGMDGSNLTPLIGPTRIGLTPAWSPDGTMIAFAGSPGGPYGIYVMNADGGDPHLIPGTDEISVADPTWSPDGKTIAFAGSNDDAEWDLYTTALDGSALAKVTDTEKLSETGPAWSPDGSRIAFARVYGLYSYAQPSGILTIAPDGSNEALVHGSDPNADVANPSWSPDGAFILFDLTQGPSEIFVERVRPDGSDLTRLSVGSEPTWQPVLGGSPTTQPSPEQTTSSSQASGRDIGLGVPVCNTSKVHGDFAGNGTTQTTWVVSEQTEGGCVGPTVIALDVDGDDLADTSFGPIECEISCSAFAAMDLNDDGIDELMVHQSGGSVLGLFPYAYDGDAIVPIEVAAPGDPDGGFRPGEQPSFPLYGDGFFTAGLSCEDGPGGREIVSTTANQKPPDQTDSVWVAHETRLVLGADHTLIVVGVRDFEQPVAGGSSSFTPGNFCGARIYGLLEG
jgi:Tol biopolymer transport system component